MTCNAEELRWLMDWGTLYLVVLLFAAAGAWRWALAAPKGDSNG